jgi:hypothetical protein
LGWQCGVSIPENNPSAKINAAIKNNPFSAFFFAPAQISCLDSKPAAVH